MITLQTRPHADAPWQAVQHFERFLPQMRETIVRSTLEARMYDQAQDRVLVQSLPALGFPVQNLNPEQLEDAVRLFA